MEDIVKWLSRGCQDLGKMISWLKILACQVHWQVEGGAKPRKGELMQAQFILIGVNLRSSRHTLYKPWPLPVWSNTTALLLCSTVNTRCEAETKDFRDQRRPRTPEAKSGLILPVVRLDELLKQGHGPGVGLGFAFCELCRVSWERGWDPAETKA